jgi:hypothetical protein
MVRWLALAAGLAFVSAACALDVRGLGGDLPDGGPRVTPPDQDAGAPGLDEGGSADAPATSEGTADGPSAIPDAPGYVDAGDALAASPEAGSTCDEDGDGHLAMGPACGGDDCCDHDAHVHPGQVAYFTSAGACGGFDYDCDGKESPEYAGASCQWSSFACSGDGFAAPTPACGATGTFTSCSLPWYNVFSCTGSNAQQAQACR